MTEDLLHMLQRFEMDALGLRMVLPFAQGAAPFALRAPGQPIAFAAAGAAQAQGLA
ncbi:hypothetical protein [Tahibacter aquaticus]|uniref:hypothetical protein n=1 Tax=Tahibacter aquaticus TaxID=520092 RepID=UPI001FB77236|nr:hypothetical protein [Tahibacter aquaticus]